MIWDRLTEEARVLAWQPIPQQSQMALAPVRDGRVLCNHHRGRHRR